MSLETCTATATGKWADTHKPIVVAVDGSERNRCAVAWATGEAEATGCKVVLVNAIEDHLVPTPHFFIKSQDQNARDMLADAWREVRHVISERDVATEVVTGSPVEVLLHRSEDAQMVVVGKRGMGGFARVIVGSTSIALAGRAKVPVSIVPEHWMQYDHQDLPVVIGIDPYRPDHNPIHLAFSRARRLGVPSSRWTAGRPPRHTPGTRPPWRVRPARGSRMRTPSSTRSSTSGGTASPTSRSWLCTHTATPQWPCSMRRNTHSSSSSVATPTASWAGSPSGRPEPYSTTRSARSWSCPPRAAEVPVGGKGDGELDSPLHNGAVRTLLQESHGTAMLARSR